jgi:hypothetical protein
VVRVPNRFAAHVATIRITATRPDLYEPIVLGRAVPLHPLMVAIDVVGGAIFSGSAGMFSRFRPVMRVLVASSDQYFTAYGWV